MSAPQVMIGPAELGDVPRLHELSVRTHQFNTGGAPARRGRAGRACIGSAGHRLVTVRLRTGFGDDGLVGAARSTGTGRRRGVAAGRGP